MVILYRQGFSLVVFTASTSSTCGKILSYERFYITSRTSKSFICHRILQDYVCQINPKINVFKERERKENYLRFQEILCQICQICLGLWICNTVLVYINIKNYTVSIFPSRLQESIAFLFILYIV